MSKDLLNYYLLKIILILIIVMVVHINTISANRVPNSHLRPKRTTDTSSDTNNEHRHHRRHRHGRRPADSLETAGDSQPPRGEN